MFYLFLPRLPLHFSDPTRSSCKSKTDLDSEHFTFSFRCEGKRASQEILGGIQTFVAAPPLILDTLDIFRFRCVSSVLFSTQLFRPKIHFDVFIYLLSRPCRPESNHRAKYTPERASSWHIRYLLYKRHIMASHIGIQYENNIIIYIYIYYIIYIYIMLYIISNNIAAFLYIL